MFAYKTNSPQYLDYIASVLSRKQIQADPNLCLLLENEYIKDNMEMAIRWNEAKYGDYQAKYDFVEYFMCNGTELDADTILHYRAKCFTDTTIMEIAHSYFANTGVIAETRKSKYGKETDDCFQNPCFYLGRFSGVMGHLGDVENTYGVFSWMSNVLRAKGLREKQVASMANKKANNGQITREEAEVKINDAKANEKKVQEKGSNSSSPVGSDNVVQPTTSDDAESECNNVPTIAMVTKCFTTVIPESFQRGWNQWWKSVTDGTTDFTDEIIQSTNGILNAEKIGDWTASKFGGMFELIAKANVRRQLGDCGRLWSQVRRLNLFSPNNAFGPINPSQLAGNQYPDGTPTDPLGNSTPNAGDANPDVKAAREAMREIVVEPIKK